MADKKVFLTGSEGFLGKVFRHLCADHDIDVCGIDLAESSGEAFAQMDLCDEELPDAIPHDVDAVVHMAAISRDRDCREDLRRAYRVNVDGTLNLMEAARQRRAQQFIFASSEWVYGDNADLDVLQTEDAAIDAMRTTSEYALTKIVGEQLLCMAQNQGFCPATVLRFGIVYGPRPRPKSAVEGLLREVMEQDIITINGSAASARRFIHVNDIARGILKAIGRTGYEIFNLSGDRIVTLKEVYETACEITERYPELRETDPSNMTIRNPDNAKAKKLLGWVPELDIRQGMQSLFAASKAGEILDGPRFVCVGTTR